MIIYKDIFTHDDMFTNGFKMKVTDHGIFYEVEGNHHYSESTKVDDNMIGGNKSAEAPEEDHTEESVVSVCDLVDASNLKECEYMDKDSYNNHLKKYVRAIVDHLKKKSRPDDAEKFKTNVQKAAVRIVNSFDDWKFFNGGSDSYDLNGMLAIMGYRSDQKTPYMLFFKDGLYEEKV